MSKNKIIDKFFSELDESQIDLFRDALQYHMLKNTILTTIEQVSKIRHTNISYELTLLSRMSALCEKLLKQIQYRNQDDERSG